MEIKNEKVLEVYGAASEETKKALESLFGKKIFKSKDVKERVKTFEDACEELGSDHQLVKSYEALCSVDTDRNLETYAQLRIIVTALNEGWTPKFTIDEYRYYPWFYFYTQEEIDNMDENEKKELCLWGGRAVAGSQCGLGYSYSHIAFSASSPSYGARLALKNRELAIYCGKQFIELWADFCLIRKNC